MSRARRALTTCLLLGATLPTAAWEVTDTPWPDLAREIRIDFGGAPAIPGILSETLRAIDWWNLVSDFRMLPVPDSGLQPCTLFTDGVSMLVFHLHLCTDHFDPWTLGVTTSVSEWSGGVGYRYDSDVFINMGPPTDGFLLELPWSSQQRAVHTRLAGTAPAGGTWQDALVAAIGQWNAIGAFTLVGVDDNADPCAGGSEQTSVAFGDEMCDWGAFDAFTLAVTLLSYRRTGGQWQLSDADMVFNTAHSWDIYDGPLQSGRIDFARVALHELGHVMGLGHSGFDDAVMYFSVNNTDQLTCDDRRGARALYGLDPDAACPPPPARPPWHDWDLYFGSDRPERPDIRRVIAHELGHLAGLHHSQESSTLMRPTIGDTDRPVCDDQAGLQALYGPEADCIEVQPAIFADGFEGLMQE